MKKRVALIGGGSGCEREISLIGCEFVLSVIDRGKYEVLNIRIEKGGEWILSDGNEEKTVYPVRLKEENGFFDGERVIPVDCAFPLLHGDFGEDGRIQGVLDTAGIKYVGCGTLSGSLAADKILTKIVAERLGIQTVPWIMRCDGKIGLNSARRIAEEELGYPMFIKPAGLGSSVGAMPVRSEKDFDSAYLNAAAYSDRILIERMLTDKREIEVGVLITGKKRVITHPGEIISSDFYSYEEKYLTKKTKILTHAPLDQKISRLAARYSERLIDTLSIRHLSRIDFFLSGGSLYLNEINTMPGFTEDSLYPRLIQEYGITPRELLSLLIEEAIGE